MKCRIDTELKTIEITGSVNIVELINFLRALDKKYWRDYEIVSPSVEMITIPNTPIIPNDPYKPYWITTDHSIEITDGSKLNIEWKK